MNLRISLKTKLSAGFFAVTVCCAVIAGALVDRNVRRSTLSAFEDRLSYETTMLGQMTATALFGEIDPTDTSLNESVRALGLAVRTELSVIANDGTMVANSEAADPHSLGSQGSAPEIVSARETGAGIAVRDGRLFVARTIVRDDKTLGFVRSSVPMIEVTSSVLAVRKRMAYGLAIALFVAVALGFAFSSKLVGPIRALSEGARRVGVGDFEHTIDAATNDEIGELARSFNDMTRNLRRTVATLDGRNHDMRIVLDNVTQGLLTLDRAGVMSKERSAIVDKWFGSAPDETTFADYVRPGDARCAGSFELQWSQLLDGFLPMELLLDQLPSRLVRGEQLFDLSFTPIFAKDAPEDLDKLLIVITDVSARVAAERAEAEQREVALILERATRDKSGVLDFLLDAGAHVDVLSAATRPPLTDTRRTLHTLKGNTALFGLRRISALCNEIEARMHESGSDISSDDVAHLREAWACIATRLSSLLGDSSQVVIDDEEYGAVLRAVVDGTSRGVVAGMVREWRMERVRDRLERFAEQVRELAQRLNKGVIEVDVSSNGLRLPRQEWSAFWSAWIHLVRNAVDHGIEPEQERRHAGKVEPGRIQLSATRDERWVVVRLADNGRGIDWESIAERARALGLPASHHDDLVEALFVDGLSSKTAPTEISGRGVGLGAMQDACQALGGHITVESEPGVGTTFQCHVPLRASIPSVRPGRESELPCSTSTTA